VLGGAVWGEVGTSTSFTPSRLSGPVTGLLFLFFFFLDAGIIRQVFTAGVAQKLVLWLLTPCKRAVLRTRRRSPKQQLCTFRNSNQVHNIQKYSVRVTVDSFQ